MGRNTATTTMFDIDDDSGIAAAARSELVIDLDEGHDTEELGILFSMQKVTKQYVTRVQIHSCLEEAEDWVDHDMMFHIFACLGELENLHHLQIHLGGMSLSVHLLAGMMDKSPKLQMLCMDSVSLTTTHAVNNEDGDEQDGFAALAKAVRDHPSLTCVCLSDIQATASQTVSPRESPTRNASDTTTNTDDFHYQPEAACLEPFLISLSKDCPDTMKVLELEDVPVSRSALQAMASSPYLRQLELWNISSVNQHIAVFCECLQNNRALEKLELCECNLGPTAAQELTTMLQSNATLKQVLLDVDWGTSVVFATPIASILQSNCTLTDLHLICRQEQQQLLPPEQQSTMSTTTKTTTTSCPAEDYAQIICREGLDRNKSLKRLGLEFRQPRRYRNDNSRLAKAFSQPLLQALQTNAVLEEFSLMGGHSVTPIEWGADVAFYLGLNRGELRQKWLVELTDVSTITTATGWIIETLLEHGKDLNTLFYLLSVHPHLLLLGGTAVNE